MTDTPDTPSPSAAGFGAGLSTATEMDTAVAEAVDSALAQLGEGPAPDLALVFASPEFAPETDTRLAAEIRARSGARHLVGCVGSGVIGAGREREGAQALSVLLGRLPGAEVRPFIVTGQEEPGEPPVEQWREQLPLGPDDEDALVVLLADPFSVEAGRLLALVDDVRPGTAVVGGIASGGREARANRLFVQDLCEDSGAVGLVLAGSVRAHTIVSQGCRPVGKHMVITRARDHVIFQIGQKAALEAFEEVIEGLDREERKLAARSLHVGRAIDEQKDHFERGDFLIRNPIAADQNTGAIAVGDRLRTGQTIQLHVRDADTAEEDLRALIASAQEDGVDPVGGLLFSCNGRGRHLFGAEGHDSNVIGEMLGEVPLAGFFCGGEFGPIGGRNFIHGYTSTLVLFSAT